MKKPPTLTIFLDWLYQYLSVRGSGTSISVDFLLKLLDDWSSFPLLQTPCKVEDFTYENMCKGRSVWSLINSTYGSVNLSMTPASTSPLFMQAGTANLGFPEFTCRFVTDEATNSVAGIVPGNVITYFNQHPKLSAKFFTGSDLSNCRYWVGLTGINEALNSSPTHPAMLLGYDTDLDSTPYWRVVTYDGTTVTRIPTKIAIKGGTQYQCELDYTCDGRINFVINGKLAKTVYTTLPSGPNTCAIQCSVTTTDAVSKVIEFKNAWISSD